MADFEVPEFFSQRRAAFLSGLSRNVVARHIADGTLAITDKGQVRRDSLESFLGFRITPQRWDDATVAIQHAGMEHA